MSVSASSSIISFKRTVQFQIKIWSSEALEGGRCEGYGDEDGEDDKGRQG